MVWARFGNNSLSRSYLESVSLVSRKHIGQNDSGMGHSIHALYTVDFARPKFAWHSVVLMADNYSDAMLGRVQTQFIDRISFEETAVEGMRVRIFARHGRIRLPPDYDEPIPKPKVSAYEIDFRLVGDTFKVTPETVPAARLFGVN